jgi:hypothetical protein
VISQVLIQFVFRLTFGVAIAMGVTPSQHVSSGFYRVHLWVLMGLNTFAALAVYALYADAEQEKQILINWQLVFGLAILVAATSYAASVVWLYEKTSLGTFVVFSVAALALMAAALATPWKDNPSSTAVFLGMLDLASSGLLLGVTMAAMLLGHWYLNTPTMELLPLNRLVMMMIAAIVARTLISGTGLVMQITDSASLETTFWIFVAFRWLSGLLATFFLAQLTWNTLKVPNTQSATGILYAGLILTFLGELTSQLLSVDALYPL